MDIDSPPTGTIIQGLANKYWISPQRDLVYAFPSYITRAFHFLESKDTAIMQEYLSSGGSEEKLLELAKLFVKYVEVTAVKSADDEVKLIDVFKELGFIEFDRKTKEVFGYALLSVILSAYYNGMKEAKHCVYYPHMLDTPEDILGSVPKKKSLWQKIKTKLFRST